MGIHNFCKLIQTVAPPSDTPDPFDVLLVDCQSFLYVAIEQSLETDDTRLFREICDYTWHQLRALLHQFTSHPCLLPGAPLTVVLSFDGEGVPMKWATQRARRQLANPSKKSFYRYVLFGHNTLTAHIQQHLLDRLKRYDRCALTVVLAGCNVPGEGEHKIFHVVETLPCRHPIVVSVDQDVFVLALLRLRQFDTVQIYRYKQFYHVTRLPTLLPYPLSRFLAVSFLFGNDFIPVLVGLSPSNAAHVHHALTFDRVLTFDAEDDAATESVPTAVATFLRRMRPHLRYDPVEHPDRLLVVCYWITYFWMLDYYTRRHFPQQFLENRVYDPFDRHQLLTALADETLSESAYREAKETYEDMVTQPIPHAERYIFTDPDLLADLRAYWVEPQNNLCCVLHLTTSSDRSTPRAATRPPATGSGTPPPRQAGTGTARTRSPPRRRTRAADPIARDAARVRAPQ